VVAGDEDIKFSRGENWLLGGNARELLGSDRKCFGRAEGTT
jgi:hypothetical protein